MLLNNLIQKAEKYFLVEKIKTGSRDLSKIDILDKMTDHDRWLIASENRKQQGLWLILTNSQKNK